MTILSRYQPGQRWEFKTNVDEFENTLVIGRVLEPRPAWGQDYDSLD
jgi:hypothetical protein